MALDWGVICGVGRSPIRGRGGRDGWGTSARGVGSKVRGMLLVGVWSFEDEPNRSPRLGAGEGIPISYRSGVHRR